MNIKKMDRKGQVEYLMENAFRIGFLMLALIIFFLLINFFIINRIDTKSLEAQAVFHRIMYSDAIMLEDPNTRTLSPGIIDMEKFTSKNLDEQINYPIKRHAAARLELIRTDNGNAVRTVHLNSEQYTLLDTLARSKVRGKGSSTIYSKIYPVTYYVNDTYLYGTLKVDVVVPNS